MKTVSRKAHVQAIINYWRETIEYQVIVKQKQAQMLLMTRYYIATHQINPHATSRQESSDSRR